MAVRPRQARGRHPGVLGLANELVTHERCVVGLASGARSTAVIVRPARSYRRTTFAELEHLGVDIDTDIDRIGASKVVEELAQRGNQLSPLVL